MKFYRCEVCGKIVALVQETPVPTICCGAPMKELMPGTTDGAHEKHVPVVEIDGNQVTVKVGSVEHPMLEAHYIQWIVLETTKGCQMKRLQPSDKPMSQFLIAEGEQVVKALEYCNLHGLWQS